MFIHAGFTNVRGVDFEFFKPLFYWDRTLWEMALALDPNLSKDHISYPNRLKLYHEIYIGHTPVTKINETIPVNKACIWNVDTGAAFKENLQLWTSKQRNFGKVMPYLICIQMKRKKLIPFFYAILIQFIPLLQIIYLRKIHSK